MEWPEQPYRQQSRRPRELLRALGVDLIGPFDLRPESEEILHLPPSRWYLNRVSRSFRRRDPEDPTGEEELAAGPDEDEEETAGAEPEPKQKKHLLASLGLSVLIPPGKGGSIRATVSFADYVAENRENKEGKCPQRVWRRVPRELIMMELPLDNHQIARGTAVPDTGGARLTGKLAPSDAPGLERGWRSH